MKKIVGIVLLCALVLVGCQNAPQSKGSQYKAVGYSDLAEPTYDATTNKAEGGPNEAFSADTDADLNEIALQSSSEILDSLFDYYHDILGEADGTITSKSISASLNLSIQDETMVMSAAEPGTGTISLDYLDARISANTDKLLPAIGQILYAFAGGESVKAEFANMEDMSNVNADLFLNSRLLADYVDADNNPVMGAAFSEYVNVHVKDFSVAKAAVSDSPVVLKGRVTADPIRLSIAGTRIFYDNADNTDSHAYDIPWTLTLEISAIDVDLSKLMEKLATCTDMVELIQNNVFKGAETMASLHFAIYDADGEIDGELTLKNEDVLSFFN